VNIGKENFTTHHHSKLISSFPGLSEADLYKKNDYAKSWNILVDKLKINVTEQRLIETYYFQMYYNDYVQWDDKCVKDHNGKYINVQAL